MCVLGGERDKVCVWGEREIVCVWGGGGERERDQRTRNASENMSALSPS